MWYEHCIRVSYIQNIRDVRWAHKVQNEDWPEVAEALVGVEAPAWLRAWAGIRIEARDGLLDSSES